MTATFDDGKDEGALRTIGEVANALGLKTHVLRYWEQQFPMLQPLKRSGGRRYYRPDDVALIETIHALVNQEGYTLKGARKVIEDGGVDRAGRKNPQAEDSSSDVQADAPPPFDLPSDDGLAADGGVGSFFATDSAEVTGEAGGEAGAAMDEAADAVVAVDDRIARREILARLQAVRADLAAALAA